MLRVTGQGLRCDLGDFHVDPSHAVDRALITHAHGDHARPGSRAYLCSEECVGVLRRRLGARPAIQGIPYGRSIRLGDVSVSFHPAGHVLGSSQIRLEHRGEIWVVSGDYKRQPDPTCTPFEPVTCHTFITESTFGLPIYRWPDPAVVFAEINAWWQDNQRAGRVSILCAYSLGKAQRLLAGVDAALGPLLVHDRIDALLPAFAAAGFSLPPTRRLGPEETSAATSPPLVIAPPSADDIIRLKASGNAEIGFASGWMHVRKLRPRAGAGRGFVLSDHADWPALVSTIRETGAHRILVTHGSTVPFSRWLCENGWDAAPLETAADPIPAEGAAAAGTD